VIAMEPKSKFITVKCASCDNEQEMFSHSTKRVECSKCRTILAEPKGGKAELTKEAKVVKVQ